MVPSPAQQDKDNPNLFLQEPGSLSKLNKLLEVAKMTEPSDNSYHNGLNSHAKVLTSVSPLFNPISQRGTSHSSPSATSLLVNNNDKQETSMSSLLSTSHFINSPWITCSPQCIPNDDQLSRILTDKSSQWFSLLPRSPCDESSVSSPAASSSPQSMSIRSPTSLSSNSLSTASCNFPDGINDLQSSVLQVVPVQFFCCCCKHYVIFDEIIVSHDLKCVFSLSERKVWHSSKQNCTAYNDRFLPALPCKSHLQTYRE